MVSGEFAICETLLAAGFFFFFPLPVLAPSRQLVEEKEKMATDASLAVCPITASCIALHPSRLRCT